MLIGMATAPWRKLRLSSWAFQFSACTLDLAALTRRRRRRPVRSAAVLHRSDHGWRLDEVGKYSNEGKDNKEQEEAHDEDGPLSDERSDNDGDAHASFTDSSADTDKDEPNDNRVLGAGKLAWARSETQPKQPARGDGGADASQQPQTAAPPKRQRGRGGAPKLPPG